MKFNLHILADRLKNIDCRTSEGCSLELTLNAVCPFVRNIKCREDTAYIIAADSIRLLENQDHDKALSFILVTEKEDVTISLPGRWNILYLYSGKRIQILENALTKAVAELAQWEEDLTDAVLEQSDLQTQMNTAVRFLKNPLALFDMSISLLAWSGTLPETILDPTWGNVLSKGYNTLETFPLYIRRQMRESVGQTKIAIVPPLTVPHENHAMIATLFNNNIPVACLAMNELCSPIDMAEYSYLAIIKRRLEHSPVLLRQIVLAKDRGSKIFLRMIRGISVSLNEETIFLRENGWRPDDCFSLYLIKSTEENIINEYSFSSFSRILLREVPSLEPFYLTGSIVAVERYAHSSAPGGGIRETLEKHGFVCGKSMVFQGYQNLRNAMLQAQAAISCATEKQRYREFKDIYKKYILSELNRQNNLFYYCHPLVLKFDLKNPWHADLLTTLYQYLITGKKIALVADRLNIHRNTVLYRLNSANHILGCVVNELPEVEQEHLRFSAMLLYAYMQENGGNTVRADQS